MRRLLAARQLGMSEVPVIQLGHLSEAQRRALVIADNQLALNAGWDEETLRIELQALQEADFDLSLVGFDDDELARLAGGRRSNHRADRRRRRARSSRDAHQRCRRSVAAWVRTSCWWATPPNADDVARLMNGDAADLVFTDPPYNAATKAIPRSASRSKTTECPTTEFKQFLASHFRSCRAVIKPGASLYVCHPSSWQREFQNALEAAGFEVRCQIIWAKNTFAWGFGRYKFQHEPIFYAHVAGQSDAWYGDKSQSTLWEENKPAANRLHPTMKPVELIERALLNSSKAGDIVADFFGGSGSTLIACERRGRQARLMELDPRYADVICRRYQEYSGKTAVLDGDGRTFDEIARQRRKEAA